MKNSIEKKLKDIETKIITKRGNKLLDEKSLFDIEPQDINGKKHWVRIIEPRKI